MAMRSRIEKLAIIREGLGGLGRMAALKKGMLLNAGELQLVTLHLLSQRPSHGYEIIKSVGALTSGVYAPSPGMVYPALARIESLAHAVSEMDRGKKLFRITQAGTDFIGEQREQLNEVLSRIDFLGRKMAFMQKHLAQDQMADERWGATSQENAEFHDLRHEFKAALMAKLTASPQEKARIMAIMRDAIAQIRSK